jgi:hypothetical protein
MSSTAPLLKYEDYSDRLIDLSIKDLSTIWSNIAIILLSVPGHSLSAKDLWEDYQTQFQQVIGKKKPCKSPIRSINSCLSKMAMLTGLLEAKSGKFKSYRFKSETPVLNSKLMDINIKIHKERVQAQRDSHKSSGKTTKCVRKHFPVSDK